MTLAPLLYSGAITSVIGKIKEGKTSTILDMVRCLRGPHSFLGYPAPADAVRVLLASEQPRASLANLTDAGLHTDDGVLVCYLADWKGQPWAVVGPALVTFAIGHGITVIVVDTASRWFRFKGDEENQSGAPSMSMCSGRSARPAAPSSCLGTAGRAAAP
jgi:hypothetical protein